MLEKDSFHNLFIVTNIFNVIAFVEIRVTLLYVIYVYNGKVEELRGKINFPRLTRFNVNLSTSGTFD